MTLKLRPYQKQGILQISRLGGRCLLSDEMGLGKSPQSLRWAEWEGTYPAIIVCPAFLKVNWQREVKAWLGIHANRIDGRRPTRAQWAGLRRSKITIINYDILEEWLPYLIDIGPQLLIVDECQYVKSIRAKRSKYVTVLARRAKHMIALSGTPFTNRPPEMWKVLNMLRPKEYPSYWPFARFYGKWRSGYYGMQYKGPKNLDHLHRRLKKTVMIRRLKKDVLKDLPEKTRVIVPLELSKTAKKEYEYARQNLVSWIRKNYGSGKARKAGRALAMVQVGYLLRLVAHLKMQGVKDWLNNFLEESDGKIVVFGVHKKFLGELHSEYGRQSVLVTGTTPQAKRWIAVDQFQGTRNTRIFLGNIQAAGVGINLTSSSTTATCEFPWTPAECSQAEDRVHRIGQRRAVFNYYLYAKGTIEERLAKMIAAKQADSNMALDGTSKNDFELFDRLIKELE